MNYYWLPFKDHRLHPDVLNRMECTDAILPFDNGLPAGFHHWGISATDRCWQDISYNDQIFVVGHGHLYSTNKISWQIDKDNIITLDICELVNKLANNLEHAKKYNLTINILACFSGNNITIFSKSLGYKLANQLKQREFNGQVVCYKGAIGTLGARGYQTGQSRVTAKCHILRSGVNTRGRTTAESAKIFIIEEEQVSSLTQGRAAESKQENQRSQEVKFTDPISSRYTMSRSELKSRGKFKHPDVAVFIVDEEYEFSCAAVLECPGNKMSENLTSQKPATVFFEKKSSDLTGGVVDSEEIIENEN
ncbi:hypothetical protein [Piscirickettsia salmonis]|uniref:hypothetical protein n=1 Tax=Piscirickettsia salmonis TaxID=1238 RepID=UPI0007C97EE7|nr:hypothetical protein A0O36_01661 [Piscirickettsiaceae bacterium NZ-RLO1]